MEFHAIANTTRFSAFVGGRGTGKSKGGAAEAVHQAISSPGSVGIVCSPSYKMLASVTKPAIFSLLHEDAIHKYDKTDECLTLTNGSVIWFRSVDDEDALRGIDASWFFLDEAALSTSGTWNVIIACLRKPNHPHHGFIATTPRGMNWVWERFASPARKPGYAMVQASSYDNPFLTKESVDSLVDTYAGRHREQEVYGRFMGFEGLVYSNFKDPNIGKFRDSTFRSSTIREVFYAHDWGHTNPMVALACGIDGDDRLYILDEFYERKATIGDVISKCHSFDRKYGAGPHLCDPSEPGLIEEMSKAGFNMVGADNSLLEGISRVYGRLEPATDSRPRLFVDESCVNTIMEFGSYSWEEDKEGRPMKEKPVKVNDHAMDSIRYLCSHLARGSNSFGLIDGTPIYDSVHRKTLDRPNPFSLW